MSQKSIRRGFTLIELLVVIAIVAILAVVVILTLNPAELLRQARDSNRIQDLNTLKTAIAHYLTDVNLPSIGLGAPSGGSQYCYTSAATSTAGTSTLGAPNTTGCGFGNIGYTATATPSRSVDGTGWIPINFRSISSGAPFGELPVDPVNTGSNTIYKYVPTSTLTFKLKAYLESTKYGNTAGTSTTTPAATDGGTDNAAYETGTNLAL